MKDAKSIFEYAKNYGESKIIDRILVRILPELVKYEQKITSEKIENSESILVPEELYDYINSVAKELINIDSDESRRNS